MAWRGMAWHGTVLVAAASLHFTSLYFLHYWSIVEYIGTYIGTYISAEGGVSSSSCFMLGGRFLLLMPMLMLGGGP